MRTSLTALLIVTILAAVSGCAQHTTPVGPLRQLSAEEKDFEAVWQASLQVLREYYFPIDNQNRRAGVILTEPIIGKAPIEFWRRDAATKTDLAEGSIQTIYRQAAVTISQTPPGSGKFTAAVEVQTFRSNRENAKLTSASDAYAMFERSGDEAMQERPAEDAADRAGSDVTELGRDQALEQKIAADIAQATAEIRSGL